MKLSDIDKVVAISAQIKDLAYLKSLAESDPKFIRILVGSREQDTKLSEECQSIVMAHIQAKINNKHDELTSLGVDCSGDGSKN